jgi:hypothetical protein
MIGHARVPDRSQKDCIEGSQLLQPVRRQHPSGSGVCFTAPVKFAPAELEAEASAGGFQYTDALWNYFLADPISRNDCDAVSFHRQDSRTVAFSHTN